MKIPLVFAAAFVLTHSAAAQMTDGNSLSDGLRLYEKWSESPQDLTAVQVHTAVSAASYLQGFLDGCGVWQLLSVNVPFRLPAEGVSPAQFAKVAQKYLSDHPEKLHKPAYDLLYEALFRAFPNPDYIKHTPPSS